MELPPFEESGDLPEGIHIATVIDVVRRFGYGSTRRAHLAMRLERILQVSVGTGHLARFVVFGSFVTDKPEPNDVDVFLLMDDQFDVSHLKGEADLLFDHAAADAHFGASVFWLRRLAVLGDEQDTIEHWQIKRDGTRRGIVELVWDQP